MSTDDNKKHCIAFIFARGGSKGIPRKNIYNLSGKPLIAYSIETALACPSIHSVIVSTDDDEIASISKKYGAQIPFIRPKSLSADKSNEYDAWKHALLEYNKIYNQKIDIFVSLPTTSPLRSVGDVEKCIEKYKKGLSDMIITTKDAKRNPYFNMVKKNSQGFVQIVNSSNGDKKYINRQSAPEIFDVTTVAYVSSPKFILNSNSLFDGKVSSVHIPEERALDIDNMYDMEIAELLIKKGNK